ncbi:hypothetical protein BLA24_06230 [Streptomyces cinnamoneus]|uniref:Uncharacterized protein n=1 Tax=Streptomyces cinnamoneus TaxID=53446 RepID=A0A2G1XN65_STRCJ|nr:hypothetical protein BLA24_06230 [Streptomyces cinnamoneus]
MSAAVIRKHPQGRPRAAERLTEQTVEAAGVLPQRLPAARILQQFEQGDQGETGRAETGGDDVEAEEADQLLLGVVGLAPGHLAGEQADQVVPGVPAPRGEESGQVLLPFQQVVGVVELEVRGRRPKRTR